VVVVIVVGLVILGPPSEWRSRTFDAQRLSDLGDLTIAIHQYWAQNGALPTSLDAAAVQEPWIADLCDPKTGEPYEYRATGGETYELCARFEIDTSRDARGEAPMAFLGHPAGRYCYALNVNDGPYVLGR
jgi:hypothetical protein